MAIASEVRRIIRESHARTDKHLEMIENTPNIPSSATIQSVTALIVELRIELESVLQALAKEVDLISERTKGI